jgi:Zn-dependent M28 family amino/carboxypeptidase
MDAAPIAPTPPSPGTPGEGADPRKATADKIIAAALADDGAWQKLAWLTDRIGHRLSGSKGMEEAVSWAVAAMKADGHENVAAEPVMVPHWVRGAESGELVAPVRRPLTLLGLGMTVGTPKGGVTGEVLIVASLDELGKLPAGAAKDKIVLFNGAMPPYDRTTGSGYGRLVGARIVGASQAAKLGARAVLIRSLTATSLNTPHTGTLWYLPDAPRIPAAAITLEDAELIARLSKSGPVTVKLALGAKMLPDAPSANVVAELRGRDKPDEIVLIGGHLDSWDVGTGAHDDGAGCVIMMQAITVLRRLGIQPRRTIRVVLFTNEENGGRGADEYRKRHAAEIERHVLAMEADSGGFAPTGFDVQGDAAMQARVRALAVALLAPLGATEVVPGSGGADVEELGKMGVPALGVRMEESRYFDYHHTHADTLDKVSPDDIKKLVAAVAVMAWAIADLPDRIDGKP